MSYRQSAHRGLTCPFEMPQKRLILLANFDDPGSAEAVAAYAAKREGDIQSRQAVIDLVNRSLLGDMFWLDSGRRPGIAGACGLWPVAPFCHVARASASGPLPSAMR